MLLIIRIGILKFIEEMGKLIYLLRKKIWFVDSVLSPYLFIKLVFLMTNVFNTK